MHLFVLALLLITFPTLANAYFDPGTGSLIIQALIGGLAAVTVFWGQLKSYVRSLLSTRPDRAPPDSADTETQGNDSSDSLD